MVENNDLRNIRITTVDGGIFIDPAWRPTEIFFCVLFPFPYLPQQSSIWVYVCYVHCIFNIINSSS